jgi:hypothetical protein
MQIRLFINWFNVETLPQRTCTEARGWVQINIALLLSRDIVVLRVNVADFKWARQCNALKTETLWDQEKPNDSHDGQGCVETCQRFPAEQSDVTVT